MIKVVRPIVPRRKNMVSGISDITSQEGKLKRYTGICHLLRHKALVTTRLKELVRSNLSFGNIQTVERHLIIAEKIGIIENLGDMYALTGLGKALVEITPNLDLNQELDQEEKIIYFTTMFNSTVKWQLVTLLTAIGVDGAKSKRLAIKDFFDTAYAQKLWSEGVVRRNLKRLNEGQIPSFFRNKFGCIESWLRDMQLIEKRDVSLYLTMGCKCVLAELQSSEDLRHKIYSLASTAYQIKASPFVYTEHKDLFSTTLKEAFFKFRGEHDLGDVRAIMPYLCAKFLRSKIVLEEDDFNGAIKNCWSEGFVRSVMLGRNGKPSYLVLSL